MLTKKQANTLRGLVARKVSTERALWALNTDENNGCDLGSAYRAKVSKDLKAANAALFDCIRSLTAADK